MNEGARVGSVAQLLLAWVTAVKQGVLPQSIITSQFDNISFEQLVLGLLDIDDQEASQLDALSSAAPSSYERSAQNFDEILQQAIRKLRLFELFGRTHDGEFHRSICPTAYNARTGQHDPDGMAHWRAYFRAMPPERQMMAATIVWMYRSGPDSIWLRRVPCTWSASESLHYMHDTGCLMLWLQLVATYPGW